ncbi:MAG: glycoside hydrolase family 97 protein, partial [Verrucomicrobiota bacterium]
APLQKAAVAVELLLVHSGMASAAKNAYSIRLQSPDGKISLSIQNTDVLKFTLTVDGQQVLGPSRLGLQLRGGTAFGRNVTVLYSRSSSTDTTWENPWGKRRQVRDQHNELRLGLAEGTTNGRKFEVIFRAFNDGIGFRYVLPEQPDLKNFVVEKELTEFTFPDNYTCLAGSQEKGFHGSQEWEFKRQHLADIHPESIIGLPLVVKTPSAWLALTESDLSDWSGMWFGGLTNGAGRAVTLVTKLASRADGEGLVKSATPHNSPWRVIMIGRQPGRLIESDLVLNLATPCQLANTSWIKPGMMAWDHWWTGDVRMDTATIKQYIQLAADMGWPYQLIDWQWYGPFARTNSDITRVNPAVDMNEVRRFAKERNVRLWLWLHRQDVTRDEAYKRAFPLYEQWGIAGIKIDGVGDHVQDTDDQESVNLYEQLTRAAATNHLMVSFHHAYKPTGLNRTLPNQITREGILGNEYDRSTKLVTPEHKLMLPFTRFLAGPGDFTPGGFVNRQPDQFQVNGKCTEVQGTRAAELALFVVYDSPICCACDSPEHYRNQPGSDFLKIVPTVWDETRVLEGEPGEHLVMVRQSGRDWFLGALTDRKPRAIRVKLNFLGSGQWTMRLWKDAADSKLQAEHLEVVERKVKASDVILLPLAPNGGAVAQLQPAH